MIVYACIRRGHKAIYTLVASGSKVWFDIPTGLANAAQSFLDHEQGA